MSTSESIMWWDRIRFLPLLMVVLSPFITGRTLEVTNHHWHWLVIVMTIACDIGLLLFAFRADTSPNPVAWRFLVSSVALFCVAAIVLLVQSAMTNSDAVFDLAGGVGIGVIALGWMIYARHRKNPTRQTKSPALVRETES
ncbi:hypothetical protein [Trueperella bialowiezensis]|uniref:Uncharacterized protein n=1 Tax=Trueperella bialowiezensis TaxID=312285 RepID=A0A3S4UYB9_9ACTO|nr:hypothetical protein [Trueperella bialowiezensis]VEI12875.1 Uncharacterised protein [Trueperella bialowiezensis]